MRNIIVPLCALTFVALIAGFSSAQEAKRTITVTGQGQATAPPDMATIHTGVVSQAKTASEALKANNQAMARLMSALKEHNVADKDLQTSSFDVQPDYRHDPQGRTEPEIVGYRVTNQVRVVVRNLPNLGQVLDALVAAGSNQISGISFGIDEPTGVMNQARNRAVADARSRAELYAQAAGVKVGDVVSISEQVAYVPQPQFFARAADSMAASVPIATGQQELQATVQMVFGLDDRE
jgi:uncharacterized protein YggE